MNLRVSTFILLIALVPLLFAMSACDSGGTNEAEVDHEFTLNVTPASFSPAGQSLATVEDTSLSGYSFFQNPPATQAPPGLNPFLLYLNENATLEEQENQEGLLGFMKTLGGRPGNGEYPIEEFSSDAFQDGEAFTFVLYYNYEKLLDNDLDGFTYYSVLDGTISFDVASDTRVSGTIDAVAEAVRIVQPDSTRGYEYRRDTTEVSGSFTARDAETVLSAPSGLPSPGR